MVVLAPATNYIGLYFMPIEDASIHQSRLRENSRGDDGPEAVAVLYKNYQSTLLSPLHGEGEGGSDVVPSKSRHISTSHNYSFSM